MGEYYNFPTQPFLQKIVGLPWTKNRSICLQKPDLGAISRKFRGSCQKRRRELSFKGVFNLKGVSTGN